MEDDAEDPPVHGRPLTQVDSATHIGFYSKLTLAGNHLHSLWVQFASLVLVVLYIPAFKW